jgi:hypothetical protein
MAVFGFLDFFELCEIVSSLDRTLDFLCENRLIRPFDEPPTCTKLLNDSHVCGLPMKIGNVSKITDGKRWKCSKYCNCSKSIREGSIFFKSKLPLQKLLVLIWHWCMGDNNFQAVQKFGLSQTTVVDWFNILREVCSSDLLTMDIRIGGPGIIVEMDESNLKKKPKHNVGSAWHMNEQWVWGAVERNDSSKFVSMFLPHHPNSIGRQIADRRRGAILTKILEWIKEDTIIYSDMCSAYWVNTSEGLRNLENIPECLEWRNLETGRVGKGYTHKAVNHSVNFVDPNEREVHTQTIEGCWSAKLKHGFKKMKGVSPALMPSYVDVAMWSSWKTASGYDIEKNQRFYVEFIEAIKRIYPFS